MIDLRSQRHTAQSKSDGGNARFAPRTPRLCIRRPSHSRGDSVLSCFAREDSTSCASWCISPRDRPLVERILRAPRLWTSSLSG
eukprot:7687220-Pyramimonas_sp.AAC.1